jgi:hypothetical protein
MLTPGLFFLESDKTKGAIKESAFYSLWHGDDLADLSSINMRPNRIKVRDGRAAVNIKIL